METYLRTIDAAFRFGSPAVRWSSSSRRDGSLSSPSSSRGCIQLTRVETELEAPDDRTATGR